MSTNNSFKTKTFQILFDGKQFCEYKHRAPVEMVTHLIVDGDVSLQQGRPNADEDGGIQVDTMIKNFMHLMCIPSRGYNLVIFLSNFSLTSDAKKNPQKQKDSCLAKCDYPS